MIELGDQQALILLSFSALGHIDVDARHALGATGVVIGDEAARFDPPDFATGSDNAKLADDLPPLFLECANLFGAQTRDIVSMHTLAPLLSADFHGAVRQAVNRRTGTQNPHGSRFDVVRIGTDAGGLVGEVELCVALGQRLLCLLAFSDVDFHADDADKFATLVGQGGGIGYNGNTPAVGSFEHDFLRLQGLPVG